MVQFTVFKGSKEGKIVKATTTREVGANEVLVKITHSVRDPFYLNPKYHNPLFPKLLAYATEALGYPSSCIEYSPNTSLTLDNRVFAVPMSITDMPIWL